ncbi:hypothetical protein GCK72_006153 [Caenorhabditis remanei]|uniref:Serine/threonine-protein kinase VRK1 n=1 Tax=Caenorhabditis remanei TaxID=31234 RepID=A0A6A5HHK7_CAERE|nr:hypothetical protein GCK72_006153 [Caenorhabditis remanei]KAF1766197.1 hypothetical protein GCK72_006153 [Caenorhabditis remanei]
MPPKKAAPKKLHELAPEVRVGFKIDDISKKTYIVGKQFATGGFGRIHTCTEEGKSHQMVMKIEPSTNGPLLTEVVVFNRILKKEMIEAYKKTKKIPWIGLPYIIANGYFTYNGDKMRYMVIPKYATSLEATRESNGGTLSVKDSLTVANCVLGALEYLHDSDYAHADVKAANILLEKEGVYSTSVLVDFGLAHRTTNNVDKPDKKRAHNGTCIYTSTDAHRGNNPSFRGDVEILAYNLIMWITGTLPWLALESSPDKVFDSKQKFIAGLPGTLQNVLTSQSPAVVGCINTMFNVSMKTNYTDKVDMTKLKKLVTDTIQTSVGEAKKAQGKVKKATEDVSKAATPKKSTRKVMAIVESEDDDDNVVEVVPKKKVAKVQKPRKVMEDESGGEEEVYIPKSSKSRKLKPEQDNSSLGSSTRSHSNRLGVTSSAASTVRAARKIEQKYKRLSTNKSSLVPVTVGDVSDDSQDDGAGTSSGARTKRSSDESVRNGVELKTPALVAPAVKKAKYKSGISSATKASPTELRRVPGVRNFPKGRRSMIIKETASKYKEKRAARESKPTFDDSSCSSEL